MKHDPQSLAESLDACRSKSDLQSPELHALAEAMQRDPEWARRLDKSLRIDQVLGAALRDVPVPAGLESRLLAALAASQAGDPSAAPPGPDLSAGEPASESFVVAPAAAAPGGSASISRRRWPAWLAVAGSLAALVLIAFIAFSRSAPSLHTEVEVAQEAAHWLEQLHPQAWSRTGFPLQEFPLPRLPRLNQAYAWQWAEPSHGSLKVACYNLTPTGPRTHLFVCRGVTDSQLGSRPPALPTRTPAGWQLGSWQAADRVYVLAVEGSVAQYRTWIGSPSSIALAAGPMTRR